MKVYQNITIDLAKNEGVAYADAVQGDSARFLRLSLEENGAAWNIPQGVVAVVRFEKPDGTGGIYDTLPDGAPAGAAQGNVLLLGLAPQVCSVAGKVHLQIVFMKENLQVSSFAMVVCVEESVNFKKESQEYVNLSAWLQQNRGKDGKDGEPGKNGKDGQTGKDGHTPVKGVDYCTDAERKDFVKEIKSDMKDDFASSVVTSATGEEILLTDSASFALRGLVLYGKSTQNGVPTPDAPVDIVHAGAEGSIVVCVNDNQTFTALTPNGLPGIRVSAGGNYTDSNAQQWICDELDYEAGVYRQWIGRLSFTGSEALSVYSSGADRLPSFVCPKTPVVWGGVMANGLVGASGYSGIVESDNTVATNATSIIFHFPGIQGVGDGYFANDTALMNAAKEKLQQLAAAETPLTVWYQLANPIETPLTDFDPAEITALSASYPATSISNHAGAGMKVSYVADIKNYIDKKFAQLQAALIQN